MTHSANSLLSVSLLGSSGIN